ncbi:MAG: bacteriohemerythrin [Azospirillum sp.]|nr:bacteriohemerythrin [Azospirillum sp.]
MRERIYPVSVGHSDLDDDHRRLYGIADRLRGAITRGADDDILGTVLSDLADYTTYHFEREEFTLMRLDFAEYERHRQEHLALIDRLAALILKFERKVETVSAETMSFIDDWLHRHVEDYDRCLAVLLERQRQAQHAQATLATGYRSPDRKD